MKIYFKKLTKTAKIPTKNNKSDAGIDFYADENVIVPANGTAKCSTGIAWQPKLNALQIAMDLNCYLQMQSRSGLAFKNSIELTNAGVIDEGFISDIGLKFYNYTDEDFEIKQGDKVAQGIPKLIPNVKIIETDELDDTERGKKGFGSSGV